MKCEFCKNEIEGTGKKYCSLSCANRGRPKKGLKTIEKSCQLCDGSFIVTSKDTRKIYCSRSCSAKANNLGKARHGQAWGKCQGCEEKASPSGSGYCSIACRQNHEIHRWIVGELDGSCKYTYASYVKRYLENRSQLICEMDGCTESRKRQNGSHILQVDHIDGDWQNNRPENLRLICPSCHCLTDNWGAANMGNGRTWKSKYNQFRAV